jgi:hypothetical protein
MTSRPYSKSRAAPSRWASVRPVGAGPDGLTNHPSACRLEATDPIKKPRNLFATVLHEGHVQVLMGQHQRARTVLPEELDHGSSRKGELPGPSTESAGGKPERHLLISGLHRLPVGTRSHGLQSVCHRAQDLPITMILQKTVRGLHLWCGLGFCHDRVISRLETLFVC